MGRHSAPDHPGHQRGGDGAPAEVTLDRITAALRSLGMEPVTDPDRPDRAVVPTYAFIATAWFSYDKPLMLVLDFTERIPTEFERSAELAEFLNEWNRDKVGPAASFRLMDSGDLAVSLRYGMRTRHGMTDEQLIAELADAFEHAAAFTTQLRHRFLPVEFDQPLPPALARAQDAEALLGRHPSERHLPRGQHRKIEDIHDVPDVFQSVGGPDDLGNPSNAGTPDNQDHLPEPVDLEALADTLEMLDFFYSVNDDEVITTGINGIAFGVCIDAGAYARVTAMWDTGTDTEGTFLTLWLTCNDFNEQSIGLRTYLVDSDGEMHLHVESTCLVSPGLSPDQRHNWMITSLVAILGAVDQLSTQIKGVSAVKWPGSAEE